VSAPPYADHNIVAEFPGLEPARSAMSALGRRGIEADNISLTGPAAAAAAEREDTSEADEAVLRHVFWNATLGAAAGTVAGAVVGATLGLILLGPLGYDTSLGNVMLCAALGGISGSIPGTLIAYINSIQAPAGWEFTLDRSRGQAIIGVHSQSAEDIELAASILRAQRPVRMYLVDSHGRRF